MKSFSSWYPLTASGVDEHAPTTSAAIQVRRAGGKLVEYPSGKSAMVWYYFTSRGGADALRRHLGDELAEPGSRGFGKLEFRYRSDPGARQALVKVLNKFVRRFGRPPMLNDTGHRQGDDGHG